MRSRDKHTKNKIHVPRRNSTKLIVFESETIKSCNSYKYLRMKITDQGTLQEAIRERNTQGGKAISLLNNIL